MRPHILIALTYLTRARGEPRHSDILAALGVLTELLFAGRVLFDAQRGRLTVPNPTPTGHDLLDSALQELAAYEGATLRKVLRGIGPACNAHAINLGVRQGWLQLGERGSLIKRLDAFVVDIAGRHRIQQDMEAVLRGSGFTDYHAAVIGSISALNLYDIAFPEEELGFSWTVLRRASKPFELGQGHFAPQLRALFAAAASIQRSRSSSSRSRRDSSFGSD